MINLDALKNLKPVLKAGSNEKADPVEFLRRLVPLVLQGVEGVAFGGPSRGFLLIPHVGQDFETVRTKLETDGIHLHKEEITANWPLELWVLSQAVLPFLSFNKDVVAYTSGNRIVGFAASPLTAMDANLTSLSSTVEKQQKDLTSLSSAVVGQQKTLQAQKLRLAALQKKMR